MKILPVGAEFLRADGQTHRESDGQMDRQKSMTNLIVVFPIMRMCIKF